MPQFQQDKFAQILTTNAAKVLNVEAAAVPTDFLTILMNLITGIFTGCLSNPIPTPAPTASMGIATQLKEANIVQKGVIRQRTIKHYLQNGHSRQDGVNAYNTMQVSVDETSVSDLAQAIEDARADAAPIPDFSQI